MPHKATTQAKQGLPAPAANHGPKVIVVEDDVAVAESLAATLRARDLGLPQIIVETTDDVMVAFNELNADHFDIYIVDLTLEDPDRPGRSSKSIGINLVRQIADASNAGVIVYSSEPARTDAVALLSIGADDYIQKPATPEILKSKVLALWRRVQQSKPTSERLFANSSRTFNLGKWRFRVGSRVLYATSGETVRLSATEHAFLKLIATTDPHQVDRKQFNTFILGLETDDDRRIDNLVYRLRKKLGESLSIVSVGDGAYKLLDVQEIRPHR